MCLGTHGGGGGELSLIKNSKCGAIHKAIRGPRESGHRIPGSVPRPIRILLLDREGNKQTQIERTIVTNRS